MADTNLHNFHLPLPQDLYTQLREEAARANQPATAIARQAIEDWLKQRRKALLFEELHRYAQAQAGTEQDFDAELESAGVEHLLGEE